MIRDVRMQLCDWPGCQAHALTWEITHGKWTRPDGWERVQVEWSRDGGHRRRSPIVRGMTAEDLCPEHVAMLTWESTQPPTQRQG